MVSNRWDVVGSRQVVGKCNRFWSLGFPCFSVLWFGGGK